MTEAITITLHIAGTLLLTAGLLILPFTKVGKTYEEWNRITRKK